MNWVISDFAALLGGSGWGREGAGSEQGSSNRGFVPSPGCSEGCKEPVPGCHVQSLQGFGHLSTSHSHNTLNFCKNLPVRVGL